MFTFNDIKSFLINGNVDATEPVRRFEAVAKIVWLLSIVSYLSSYFGREFSSFEGLSLKLNGLLIIVNLFLIYYIAWNANYWIRWVFVFFQLLGFVSFTILAKQFLTYNLVGFLITLFQYELALYAIYLLFELDKFPIIRWLVRRPASTTLNDPK